MFAELGYYTCDGKAFETKLQAMLYANPKNLPIEWNFNNSTFDSYNWSKEPELSLDTLYDLRARQIREEYDYVILSYSGGSDSNNILESFLRQGLLIDEIITNWALDAGSKFIVKDPTVKDPWNNNAEFYLHTTERLNYIRNKSPRTKITMIDSSKAIVDSLIDGDDATWVQTKNDVFNATGAFQFNPLYYKEVRKRFDKMTKIAYVIGIDKPKLKVVGNSLFLYFLDKTTGIIPIKENIAEYSNVVPVFFYWAPSTVDLLCKQAHTVLKYIKTNPIAKTIWASNDVYYLRVVQEKLLRNIVYTTWNENWFQANKTLNDWNCEWDYWFTKGWQGTKEYGLWIDGLKNLAPLISNYTMYEKDGSIRGTKPYLSKLHYIGNIEIQ